MQSEIHQRFQAHTLLFDPQMMLDISILIVGVGGIGCQLLKVLSKSPINSIHILDMDTIQISNLNRQFLFKAQHKGQSKALVAKQSISRLNPHINIEAHHKNISELPISFFKNFNFLVMALDNIEARNYVNKIGIRLNIPIVDAGTLAYLGNARIIIPKITSCYSCQPKSSSQKSYPVCTIRMRPEKPIHCVVWGKMLFEVFFSHCQNNIIQQQQQEGGEGDMDDLSELIKKQLFHTEIQHIKNAKTEADNALSEMYMKKIQPLPVQILKSNSLNINLNQFEQFDEKLTLQTHISIAKTAYKILLDEKRQNGSVIFEKDDDNIIHFISAMANIRMKCFSIENGNLSFNQIKNMAGNIVPAIASTNSIVSGLEVLEMMKYIVYQGSLTFLKSYYIQNQSYKVRGMKIQEPNRQCLVCSEKAIPCVIEVNFNVCSFKSIILTIQKYLQDLNQFSINLGSKQLYNSQEPNKIIEQKRLVELCPTNNSQIQLILTDQDTSQKICSIWIINTGNINMPTLTNENPLKNRPVINKNVQQKMQNQQKQKQQDSDIVQMVDNVPAGQEEDIVEIVQNNVQDKTIIRGSQMVDENDQVIQNKVQKRRKLE